MDRFVALLRDFSRTFVADTAKIETAQCGFAFLDTLLAGGVRLEYGELTPLRLVHRYKLVDISAARMLDFLGDHTRSVHNVCRYFDPARNDLFCFNLDNNRQADQSSLTPEMDRAIRSLRDGLSALGCEPLVVSSGRGFHAWCRLSEPVDNERLYRFMLPVAAHAWGSLHAAGQDLTRVKFNLYPHTRLRNVVSLRLFGTRHAKTGRFSQVWTTDGLLDEQASWDAFERFVQQGGVALSRFDAACQAADARVPS